MLLLAIFLLYGSCIAALDIGQNDSSGTSGLRLLADPPGAEIDIVAVHGLDGDWRGSWTAANGVYWLQDLLPSRIPKARIYSYSYDSRTRGSSHKLTLDITHHGEALVGDLTIERGLTDTEQRPIMFVGHSLGGLVIKTALIHSHMANVKHLEKQKSVELSTYAIMFLGTPHRGSEAARLAKALIMMFSIFSHTNIKLLHQIKLDGDWVERLQAQYNSISNNFETVFFYETLAMPTLLGSTIVVPKSSAVVFGAVDTESVPMVADHSTMVKFSGPYDKNFLAVSKRLEFYSTKAAAIVQQNWQRWISEKAKDHALNETVDQELEEKAKRVPKEYSLGVQGFKAAWNRHFTGRNRTLQLMDDILQHGTTVERKETVLYGTGGVGKTQLALEYARLRQNIYGSIFWIDARHPDTVKTSIEKSGNRILDHYEENGMTETPRFKFLNKTIHSGDATKALYTWLEYEGNDSWLLIIDNLDDPKTVSLKDILPSKDCGSVIITSRRSDLAIIRNSFLVPEMEQNEAFTLLTTSSQIVPKTGTEEWQNAHAIIQQLGCLPLAISQAGAHIALESSENPFEEYLKHYRDYPREFLSQRARESAWDEKHDAVLTTWEISFEAVRTKMPEAAEILLISGFLAPEGIAQGIFTSGDFFSELQVLQAFQVLRSFSLFQHSVGNGGISIHPLIHLWTRLRLNLDEHIIALKKVASMLYAYIQGPGGSRDNYYNHISHFYSIYTNTGPFVCTSPVKPADLSAARHNLAEGGNVFNLYPYGRAVHFVQTHFASTGRALFQLASRPFKAKEFDVVMQELRHFDELSRYMSTEEGDQSKAEKEKLQFYEWIFCRATILFPSQDPAVLDTLFSSAASFDIVPELEHNTLYRGWYASLLIWYGQLTVERHPVIAAIYLGSGLSLKICHKEVVELYQAHIETADVEYLNGPRAKLDTCLRSRIISSEVVSDLSRTIASWSVAVTVFSYHEPPESSQETDTYAMDVYWDRDATDPFSRAVLQGHIGDDVETVPVYLLLQLLDWKKHACLRSWPSSLTYLARNFHRLGGNRFGGESVRQLTDTWSYENSKRFPPRVYYTKERFEKVFDKLADEAKSPADLDHIKRMMDMVQPISSKNEFLLYMSRNHAVCQMGQLALYLSMWYAGTGNFTGSNDWLSTIYRKPLEAPNEPTIRWQEGCRFREAQPEPPQVQLSFLDDVSTHAVADHETDGVFDYIANAAVDILRGFHHNAIQKGRFSKQGAQDWPNVSKSMAQLLLGPGMQKAASQDADFADFLVRSGNVPGGTTQEARQVLRAWDTYGKRCPGRMLRQTIVDSVGCFTPRGALPWSCWVDNPLSVTCPAVRSVTREQEEVLESKERKHFVARIWKFWSRKRG